MLRLTHRNAYGLGALPRRRKWTLVMQDSRYLTSAAQIYAIGADRITRGEIR